MKKVLSIFSCFILVFTMFASISVYAAEGITGTISSTAAKQGDTVTITVSITNNSGFSFLSVTPNYDSSAFTLTAENGTICQSFYSGKNLIWNGNGVNITAAGTLVKLKIKINENAAPKAYPISLTVRECYASVNTTDTKDVACSISSGNITVNCKAHTYTAYTKVNDSTHKRTCTACGHEETSSHTWNATVTKQPTCKESGSKHFECTACKAVKDETLSKTNNHSWGSYEIKTNPSCTQAGEEKRSCKDCGHTETRAISPLGHSFTNPTVTKQPTCTESGEESGKCTLCGQTTAQSIKPLGHKFSNWSDLKAPTCTDGGIQERKCTVCGAVETRNTSALGHDFENPTVIKEPTISETGLKEGKCKRCGETASEVIPCSVKDEATGTLFEANEGTFEKGSEIRVEEIKEDNPALESVKNILKEICKEFKLYDITAYLNGAKIQPNGEVTVTFEIPEGFGKNVAVYYITENGSYEKLESAVSEDGSTVKTKISHFSNYAVCKISEETDEVMKDETNNETEAKNGQSNKIWIIVLTAVILLAGAGTGAFFYIRKKKQLNRFFED